MSISVCVGWASGVDVWRNEGGRKGEVRERDMRRLTGKTAETEVCVHWQPLFASSPTYPSSLMKCVSYVRRDTKSETAGRRLIVKAEQKGDEGEHAGRSADKTKGSQGRPVGRSRRLLAACTSAVGPKHMTMFKVFERVRGKRREEGRKQGRAYAM